LLTIELKGIAKASPFQGLGGLPEAVIETGDDPGVFCPDVQLPTEHVSIQDVP
jgi:hypothetical protein